MLRFLLEVVYVATNSEKGRRQKGTGSIFQRSDGSWVAKAPPAYAGAPPKTLYGKSEREVRAKLKEYRATPEATAGRKLSTETMRVTLNFGLKHLKRLS
jgi:hypothetical protein